MRHLPRREWLPLLLLSAAALTACTGQVAETGQDNPSIVRGAEVTSALRYDNSPPLTLLPVAPPSTELVEHEVKRVPRQINLSAPSDPVVQPNAPALLVPATSLNFDGVGQGFSGPAGTF